MQQLEGSRILQIMEIFVHQQFIQTYSSPEMSYHISKLLAGLNSLAKHEKQYVYEYSPQKIYQCTITELFEADLHHRYPHFHAQQIALDFSDSLSLPGELLGRKSPQIVVSNSRKFCLKMIDQETLQKMEEIFTEILEFKDHHEQNFLVDIYRVYKVESIREKFHRTDLYILMPSLRGTFDDIISVFDIKGYVDSGRSLSAEDFVTFKFGKDENFISSKQLDLIRSIPMKYRLKMIDKMTQSVKFLESKNLIDYSLLICLRKKSMSGAEVDELRRKNILQISEGIIMEWQIIDYFQEFNIKKKMEMKMKTLLKKEVSSAEPDVYSKRFVEFMKKYVLQNSS